MISVCVVMKMNEKNFLDKKNTVIYENGTVLPAVIDFVIKVISSSEGLYEIFNDEPWQIIKENTSYEITLKQLGKLVDSAQDENFELTFEIPEGNVRFQGCSTVSTKTTCNDKGNIILERIIRAERMC